MSTSALITWNSRFVLEALDTAIVRLRLFTDAVEETAPDSNFGWYAEEAIWNMEELRRIIRIGEF